MSQSKTKLLELINSSNFPPIPLTDANVVLGAPVANDGGARWNTSISVTAKPGQGFTGSRTLFYRRLDLAILPVLSFPAANALDAQSLLNLLNLHSGAELELEDLQDFTIPAVGPGASASCTLVAAVGSLRWIGQQTITLAGAMVDCDPPAAVPTLRVSDWWVTLNRFCFTLDANPYGGMFVQHRYEGLTKLDEAGSVLWRKTFVSATYTDYAPQSLQMKNYQQNELCILTASQGGNGVIALVALDSTSGEAAWSRVLPAPAELTNYGAFDTHGGCIYLGANVIEGAGANRSAALVKLRQDGTIGWQQQLKSQSSSYYTTTEAVVTDSQENSYVLAVESGRVSAASLVKFDKYGALQWQHTYDGTVSGYYRLALHPSGDVVLSAMSINNTFSLVSRLSAADGSVLWSTAVTPIGAAADFGSPSYTSAITGLVCDDQGAVYLQTNTSVHKLDASGAELWSMQADVNGDITHQNAGLGGPTQTLSVRQGVLYTSWTDNNDSGSPCTIALALPLDGSAGEGAYLFSSGRTLNLMPNTLQQLGAASPALSVSGSALPLLLTSAALTIQAGDILTVDDSDPTWGLPQSLPTPPALLAVSSAQIVVNP